MLTLETIKESLAEIKAMSGDNEVAHCLEDELYVNVLAAIANGTCEKPRQAAALALTSQNFDHIRWYS